MPGRSSLNSCEDIQASCMRSFASFNSGPGFNLPLFLLQLIGSCTSCGSVFLHPQLAVRACPGSADPSESEVPCRTQTPVRWGSCSSFLEVAGESLNSVLRSGRAFDPAEVADRSHIYLGHRTSTGKTPKIYPKQKHLTGCIDCGWFTWRR